MTDPISTFLGYAQQFSNDKRMATGSVISEPTAIGSAYKESFDALVTSIYRWYGEAMRQDRGFLEPLASSHERMKLRGFWNIVKDQRHEKQHDDYDRAAAAREWRTQARASNTAASEQDSQWRDALLAELHAAMKILCAVARRVAQDQQLALSWRERLATSPIEEVSTVYSHLGLHPTKKTIEYVVRQYTAHPKLQSAHSSSQRAKIAQLVVIGIGLKPLSIAYDQLLDKFNLIGSSSARSLLMLAHGVEESGHSDSSTVSILESIWPTVRPTG